MTPTGDLTYVDCYGQQYETTWITVGGIIDLTTVIKQPYDWGTTIVGRVDRHKLYKNGITTVHRQLLRQLADGYEIVAEGAVQYRDEIEVNFNCRPKPNDPFRYHFDNGIADREESVYITEGPHWADPSVVADESMVWSDVDVDGSMSVETGMEAFAWVDVWA